MGFGAGSEGGRGWGGDGRPLNVVCVCAFLEVSSVGVQTRAGAVRDSGVSGPREYVQRRELVCGAVEKKHDSVHHSIETNGNGQNARHPTEHRRVRVAAVDGWLIITPRSVGESI